jgi:hypothetical protein
MSAQIPETLIFDDDALAMCSEPLDRWLNEQQLELCVERASPNCLRGYLGTWEVRRGHLYLSALRAIGGRCVLRRPGEPTALELSLEALFPSCDGPVRADWYSGPLRCPQGPLLQRCDAGYGNVYEHDMLVDIERGRVERIVFRHNDIEPSRVLTRRVERMLPGGGVAGVGAHLGPVHTECVTV